MVRPSGTHSNPTGMPQRKQAEKGIWDFPAYRPEPAGPPGAGMVGIRGRSDRGVPGNPANRRTGVLARGTGRRVGKRGAGSVSQRVDSGACDADFEQNQWEGADRGRACRWSGECLAGAPSATGLGATIRGATRDPGAIAGDTGAAGVISTGECPAKSRPVRRADINPIPASS